MVDLKNFKIKFYFCEVCRYLMCGDCNLIYFMDDVIKYYGIYVNFDVFIGYWG